MGAVRCEPAAPPHPSAPAAVRSPRSRWSDAPPAPRRRPPCRIPRTHTSAAAAHAAGTLGAATPACPGHRQSRWGPSGSLPWGWGATEGLSAKPGDVPASPWAWQWQGGLTFRSAGNSSFFTSPVAAAMLPAPENAASPSWDACSFAFSATARAGGAHQCPPVPGRGAQLWLRAPHCSGGGWWGVAGQDQAPPPAQALGRGGGWDAALQLGRECEQPPQILLRCGPCYVRGFSRVTSAPQLASDLVSAAALSGPEGYRGGEPEETVPEVTPCTTPWVLLPGGRKRQRRC